MQRKMNRLKKSDFQIFANFYLAEMWDFNGLSSGKLEITYLAESPR
jgi:hypothetical protein